MAIETEAPVAELPDVLRALAHPIRLEIVRRMSLDGEVACTLLEDVLDVKKSTISHHIKVLYFADLITIRRDGRFFHYSLRRDTLTSRLPGIENSLETLEPYSPEIGAA